MIESCLKINQYIYIYIYNPKDNTVALYQYRHAWYYMCNFDMDLSALEEVSNIGFITVHGLNEGHIAPSALEENLVNCELT